MAQVGAVDYTAGPDGAAITPANTAGLSPTQNGVAPTFSADVPPDYINADFSAWVNTSSGSYNNIDWTAGPLAWLSFYLKLPAMPATDSYPMIWFDGSGGRIGDLRFNAGAGSLLLRDNFGAVLAASTVLPLNVWHRVAIRVQPGSATGHQLRLYLGENRHGDTPDFDSGGLPATAAGRTNVGRWRFGLISGLSVNFKIARQRVDNAAEPAPIVPVAETRYRYFVDGTELKPSVRKFVSGGSLV